MSRLRSTTELLGLGGATRIRTEDLRLMRTAGYQAALSRVAIARLQGLASSRKCSVMDSNHRYTLIKSQGQLTALATEQSP